jgi:hypothetical protein
LPKNKPKSSAATLASPSFPPKLTRDVRSASASGLQIANPNHLRNDLRRYHFSFKTSLSSGARTANFPVLLKHLWQ